MEFIKSLKKPDVLSLFALFFAWSSIVSIISYNPRQAIFLMLLALLFDYFDGNLARKNKVDSKRGRYLDTFIDIITYLIFSSLFYVLFLSPSLWLGLFIGFFILLFGVLRLLRYSEEGILKDEKGSYYRGVTVLHINFLITLGYYLKVNGLYNAYFFELIVFIASLLMLSNYKTHKKQTPVLWFIMLLAFLFSFHGN